MAKTLLEYSDWLAERELKWPAPPKVQPVNAAPSMKPLEDIRGVTWSIYGTLLRITDGQLMFIHPQTIRMEVAAEKTIHEFNMWNSMSRKPGAPWEYMFYQYKRLVDDRLLAASPIPGEAPEIDAAGTRAERTLNANEEHGFLWRLNTYWSYEERDGGLYLQIEAVSLTRSIPSGLGWLIRPYIESIPRESLEFTLRSVSGALGK